MSRPRNLSHRQHVSENDALSHTGSHQQHAHNPAHAAVPLFATRPRGSHSTRWSFLERAAASTLQTLIFPQRRARDAPCTETGRNRGHHGETPIRTLLRFVIRQTFCRQARGARLFLPILGAVLTFAPLPPTRSHLQPTLGYLLSSADQWGTASSFSCTPGRIRSSLLDIDFPRGLYRRVDE